VYSFPPILTQVVSGRSCDRGLTERSDGGLPWMAISENQKDRQVCICRNRRRDVLYSDLYDPCCAPNSQGIDAFHICGIS
jgi:hypothetical protein